MEVKRLKVFSILDFGFWISIENQKSKIKNVSCFASCAFLIAGSLCISGAAVEARLQSVDDLTAIRELLLTLERGYEERDVEKYVTIFSDEEYEYASDMTTPDDPSDDIHLLGKLREMRAAIRVFRAYKNIDLETTDPDITIDGDSAEARNKIDIVFVEFENPHIPDIYYAASLNTFSLKKIKGEWKVVRWQQHEMSAEELAAREQKGWKDKGMEELIRDLGDDRLGTWANAMATLRKKRGAAIGPLIDALKSHNSSRNVRIRVAKVLCGTRNEDAIQALIGILDNEKDDVHVRVAAANALGECDSQKVDEPLFAAAKGNEPELKSAASLVLARRIRKRMDDFYWIATAGLQDEDKTVREAAAESLGIMMSTQFGRRPSLTPGERGAESCSGASLLEQRFRDRSESENVRLAALESLNSLEVRTESLLRVFRDTLKDETETVQIRIRAARALADAKDYQSLELLMDVAKNKKEAFELRKEAIVALGAMGNSKAVKPLISLLNHQLDADLRREVVKVLAEQLGDHRALKPLMMILMNRDEDIFVRRLAGRGIVRIDQDIAFGPLVQIMSDGTESAPARRMAVEILASSRDHRSIPQLIKVLEDEQQPWWFRRIVADHMGNFRNSTTCVAALETAADDTDERVAKAAQDALKKMDIQPSATP